MFGAELKCFKWRSLCSLFRLSQANKTTILILMWQLINDLLFYTFLEASYLSVVMDTRNAILTISAEVVLTVFSPLAGLLADMKYGRYKVLQMSTHFMIAFEILALLSWIVISTITNSTDVKLYLIMLLFVVSLIGYFLGRVFFLANLIQFGTDQLRDMPTAKSDAYIHLVMFIKHFANLFVKVWKSLASSRIKLDNPANIVQHHNTINAVVFELCISASIILSVTIIFLVEKHSNKFLSESIKGNPYKLVYQVIKFARKHKKPIRRSAFTFCEDERPSRIDYCKQKYGGPFTTEQVEDVKSLLSILKVLTISSPFFLLDLYSRIVISHFENYAISKSLMTKLLLENGILSSLIVSISIPSFLFLVKTHYIPSIFKRMGMSFLILCILYLVYITCGLISKADQSYVFNSLCLGFNKSNIHGWEIVDIPKTVLPTVQQVLSSLSQMLFYIAVWQFICCQSPQYMKGLLFGAYLFIRAVVQLLASVLLYFYLHIWEIFGFGCRFDFHLLLLFISVTTLISFSFVVRKYKYRKRDDICNVYQYAEDYYSTNN